MTPAARDVRTVPSADGTPISYVRSGSGPTVMLVHGGGADASSMVLVAKELARTYTVLLVERRGRDRPLDRSAYSLELEYDDLIAVAVDAGKPVHLVAHSYGGLCALGAAAQRPELVRALTLYEPPIPTPEHPYATEDDLRELAALLEAGALEDAALLALRRVVKVPEHELESWRALPGVWQEQIDRAHVFAWELPTVRRYRLDPSMLARIRAPITMILGEGNRVAAPQYVATIEALHALVPDLRTIVLPGQFHLATAYAPAAVAGAILEAERFAASSA